MNLIYWKTKWFEFTFGLIDKPMDKLIDIKIIRKDSNKNTEVEGKNSENG